MKTEHYEMELLTRCLLGGARPAEVAELRASSIRGQLRWWFRTLGGFKQFQSTTLRRQEDDVFGVASGDTGNAGNLRVQILQPRRPSIQIVGESNQSEFATEKYLLWPFFQSKNDIPNDRAYLAAGTRFQLRIHWRGDPALWPSVLALVDVVGSLGALGTRSRRAMGALGFVHAVSDLRAALNLFSTPTGIDVRQLNGRYSTGESAVVALANWLRGWRQHGRTADHSAPPNDPTNPGFDFALRDHDEGVAALGQPRPTQRRSMHVPKGAAGDTMRAVLGLPLNQRFGGKSTVKWTFDAAGKQSRFASPVILRPYRAAPSDWKPLIIFVDGHQWPKDSSGKPNPVYLNGSPRKASDELYREMKKKTPILFP